MKNTSPIAQTAYEQFAKNPSAKCFQRHMREAWAKIEQRPVLPKELLRQCKVAPIDIDSATALIERYEWLGSMASGTTACYGLKLNDELLGAVCFNKGVQHEARNLCGPENNDKVICLARGACVPHAPDNAASFLIRYACKEAHKAFGWAVFIAYSDSSAGEVGTVYQAVGWNYLGVGNGRPGKQPFHTSFVNPKTGKEISTYMIKSVAEKLGWRPELDVSKRDFLRKKGFKDVRIPDKARWVWFEGPKAGVLKQACKYPFLPYPKRPTNDLANA